MDARGLPSVPGRAGRWSTRWLCPISVGLTVAILVSGAVLFWVAWTGEAGRFAGVDLEHYLAATRRWIESGTPYLASEVAAPFDFQPLTFLHPPIALLLFAPFLVLPTVLWWAVPLGIVAWAVISFRPAVWAWPLLAVLVAYPRSHVPIMVGNSDLWVWAGVALGLRFGWPALVVIVKPSLAPLILAGVRHRSWWIGATLIGLPCLAFGTLWTDWLRVVLNAPGGWSYSLANVPWLMLPVLAWAARSRPPQPA